MSDQKKPLDLSGVADWLVADLELGARSAKALWRGTVAPRLQDLGRRARAGSGKVAEQAGDVFTDIGKRLREAGDKLGKK